MLFQDLLTLHVWEAYVRKTKVMDFFFQVAQLFKSTDSFLAEKAKASSPLLQVQLFETAQDWTEKLNALQQQLNVRQERLVTELKELDERWMNAAERKLMFGRLEELYRLFSYFARWQSQIQEKVLQLSL